jgi:hypothetical protein
MTGAPRNAPLFSERPALRAVPLPAGAWLGLHGKLRARRAAGGWKGRNSTGPDLERGEHLTRVVIGWLEERGLEHADGVWIVQRLPSPD